MSDDRGEKSYIMVMRIFAIIFLCLPAPILSAASNFEGIWLLNGPGTESEIRLTTEGRLIQGEYDLLVDDPSLQCVPASASRVWANPNSRIKIEQSEDRLLISYELFDLRREIPIGDESMLGETPSTRNLSGTYFPEMGSSFAYYRGDNLVIESRNHVHGYIRTSRGIPQGTNTVTTEELELDGDTLKITHTYMDDRIFEVPLVLEYFYERIDEPDILLYECTGADYDWFLELNSNN